MCIISSRYTNCLPLSIPVSIPLGLQKIQYTMFTNARDDEAAMMVNSSGGSSASFIHDDGVQA